MPLLSDAEIEQELSGLEGWERSGDAIAKTFDNGDFDGSIAFVNRIAPVADEMDHHPDLEISWSKVAVSLSTHSQGGITASDVELARRIEALGG